VIKDAYHRKASMEHAEALRGLERFVILNAVDRLWQEHLYAMDGFREAVSFLAFAQKDPLVEYKNEAFAMFGELMDNIKLEVLNNLFRSTTNLQAFETLLRSLPQNLIQADIPGLSRPEPAAPLAEKSEEAPAPKIELPIKRELPKVGRNDPCPCGSGKKYKQCHLPIEEAAAAEQLRLRRSVDTLMPKIIVAAQGQVGAIPAAFERFWDGKYTPEQLEDLDDLEGRGGERFLTWFAFDYPLEDGRTLVEQLATGDAGTNDSAADHADGQADALDLTNAETQLLHDWVNVRLRPYLAQNVRKGQGIQVSDLLDERSYEVDDQAASRRVEPGEVVVAHLVPAGTRYYVSNPAVVYVSADGLATAQAVGTATVTIINGPAEAVVPVTVEAPHAPGPVTLGAAVAAVTETDGPRQHRQVRLQQRAQRLCRFSHTCFVCR
jgi:hypothetical protein